MTILSGVLKLFETILKVSSTRHFWPKLVHLNERVYFTPIDTALKMRFNEWSGNILWPTFPELWNFSGINCSLFGRNKYKNRRGFWTILCHKTGFQSPKTNLPVSFLQDIWKNICHVIFYWLTKFCCLVTFISWDIEHYVYCNYFLSSLWRHKLSFLVQLFFCINKKSGQNPKYLKSKKCF